ncbi:hypothetical protein [Streptomyces sp. NRRL S-481]|uniref:hypothetical protein n=1 Tax=Streptomyces sp. NRRL S-481 TaxID=1463911 RepID=UPI0004CB36DB|nr:hypothetical protein [Streptomyces sp. NRRL S-481]
MTSRSTDFTFGLTWLVDFFHQDWPLDASDEAEVVANQFVDDLDPETVLLVRRDARLLLDTLTPDQIAVLWLSAGEKDAFRFGRSPASASPPVWMRTVIRECDRWLENHMHGRLSGGDLEDGFGLVDEIVEEIRKYGDSIGADSVEALTVCARRCTPDLAFRFFLKALSSKLLSLPLREKHFLTASRYERLGEIGEALNYGEFIVSELEHMVDN